jgi:hypothetical protein
MEKKLTLELIGVYNDIINIVESNCVCNQDYIQAAYSHAKKRYKVLTDKIIDKKERRKKNDRL